MSKIKFELEFVIQASPQLLYQYMHTPSGLSEWFADNVNARTEKYSFIWDDSEEEALLLRKKPNEGFQKQHPHTKIRGFELKKVVKLQLVARHLG